MVVRMKVSVLGSPSTMATAHGPSWSGISLVGDLVDGFISDPKSISDQETMRNFKAMILLLLEVPPYRIYGYDDANSSCSRSQTGDSLRTL